MRSEYGLFYRSALINCLTDHIIITRTVFYMKQLRLIKTNLRLNVQNDAISVNTY